MSNLIEGIQEEQKRIRELKPLYEEIGPEGMFGLSIINQALDQADKAIASGDVIEMLVVYKELKKVTG